MKNQEYVLFKARNEWQLAADRILAEHFDVSLAGFRCDLAQNASICLISEQFKGTDHILSIRYNQLGIK